MADILKKEGKLEEAIKAFSDVNLKGKSLLHGLSMMMLALLYEKNKDCKSAVELWQEVILNFSFLKNTARIKMALCLLNSDKTRALEILTKLTLDSSDSEEAKLARKIIAGNR